MQTALAFTMTCVMCTLHTTPLATHTQKRLYEFNTQIIENKGEPPARVW